MISCLDPTQGAERRMVLAPRLDTLQGKTIGLLWNNRPRGDWVLRALGDALTVQHGTREIVFARKLRVGVGAPSEIVDDLVRRCDAVVVGVGD